MNLTDHLASQMAALREAGTFKEELVLSRRRDPACGSAGGKS